MLRAWGKLTQKVSWNALGAGATGRLLGERHIAAPAERYSAKAILGAARGTLAAPALESNAS